MASYTTWYISMESDHHLKMQATFEISGVKVQTFHHFAPFLCKLCPNHTLYSKSKFFMDLSFYEYHERVG